MKFNKYMLINKILILFHIHMYVHIYNKEAIEVSKSKYAIGIDYGTQSERVVVVDIKDGQGLASSVSVYSTG